MTIVIIIITIPEGIVNNKDTRKQRHQRRSDICIVNLGSGASTVDFEQVNAHWDYKHSGDFSHCFTQSFLEKNFIFSKIFKEL